MLRDSVESFHAFFPRATYIVSYAQDSLIEGKCTLPDYLQWHSLPARSGIAAGDELWLKWFPQDITDRADLMIAVDADVFCVAQPTSLVRWIRDDISKTICCMEESNPEGWCYGNYYPRLRTLPHVNAGFVASREPAELTRCMMTKYAKYRGWAEKLHRKWHDEQGALAEYWLELEKENRASTLPQIKNKLLCPSTNAHITSLNGLELIHTPYPEHPKYYELKDQIRAAIHTKTTSPPRPRRYAER